MLAAFRLQDDRAARKWEHYPVRDVAGRTVVILGIGAIGSRFAQLAKAAGMHVTGINSSGKRPDAPVDEYCAADRLAELAPRADVLVIRLPETCDTVGMVDARVLAALPAGAVVVNVGRGRVVDEGTLVELQAGRLAGAALHVTAKEPPDPHSLLWELPSVILSPPRRSPVAARERAHRRPVHRQRAPTRQRASGPQPDHGSQALLTSLAATRVRCDGQQLGGGAGRHGPRDDAQWTTRPRQHETAD